MPNTGAFQQRQLVLAERSKHKRKRQHTKKNDTKTKVNSIIKTLFRLYIFPFYVSFVFLEWLMIKKPWEYISLVKSKLKQELEVSEKAYIKANTLKEGTSVERKVLEKKKAKPAKKSLIKGFISKVFYVFKKVLFTLKFILSKLWLAKADVKLKFKRLIKKLYGLWDDTELICYKTKALPYTIFLKVKLFLEDSISDEVEIEVSTASEQEVYTEHSTTSPVYAIEEHQPRSSHSSSRARASTSKFCPLTPGTRNLLTLNRSPPRSSSVRFTQEVKFGGSTFEDSMKMRSGLIEKERPLTREELIEEFFYNYDAVSGRSRPHIRRNSTLSSTC